MSNFGQGVAAVAGAVVGFAVGGPTGAAYGFQIGLLAGSALFPTQLPGVTGPRLEDIDQTAAEPGAPVPIPYGTIALSGSTIWLGPVVEETQTDTVGGKGAPEQDVTTYTYRQSIAVGLCEGPITSVLRIWENGKLVYDLRPQQDVETDDEYTARVDSSTDYATGFQLYTGTEDQLPDPTIEADKGAGNVPAFRGLAYIVYPDRLLRDDQGRRHPAFRFEVSNLPAVVPIVVFTQSGTWTKPDGLLSARVKCIGGGGGGASGQAIGGTNIVQLVAGAGGGGGAINEATFNAAALPATVPVTVGAGGAGGAGGQDASETFTTVQNGGAGGATSFGAFVTAAGGQGGGTINGIEPGSGGVGGIEAGGDGGKGTFTRISNPNPDPGESTLRSAAGGGGAGAWKTLFGGRINADGGGSTAVLNGGAGGTTVMNANAATGISGGAGEDSEVYDGGGGGGGGGGAQAGLGKTPTGGATAGSGGRGGLYGGGGGGGGPAQTTRQFVADPITTASAGDGGDGAPGVCVVYQTFDTVTLSLADVVADICHRAGLFDIDVEDLRNITIDGYAIGRPMPARSAIEPLRSFGYFDVVESGAVLRFRVRGGAPVLTLSAAAIGAHEAGEDAPPAITTRKLQDVELPRQVRIRYLDTGRDYENGEQLSPVRLTTDAENDVEIDLPIAMSGARAAQIAEVLWSDAWRSRWVHSLVLEGRYPELEPTDVLEVPVDGRVQRMRIVSIDDDGGALRRLELVRDDDGAYVSYAVAAEPDRRPNTITRLQNTGLVVLDLPALRDSDDDAGVYAAVYPTGIGTRWDGCVIYRSADGGATFASVGSVVEATPVGTLAEQLDDGITSTFDEAASILVDMDYGELESRTEAAVLDGANAAAIGNDGRWQIVQFRDVEQITPTRYRLTGILRGRRGTEHESANGLIGERFVMLSTGSLARLGLQNSEIGAERVYRAVTIGATFNSGTNQTVTGRGVALRPFSPIDVTLSQEINGDIVIAWIRRNRLGQELRDGVEIPMSEATESYEVDIFQVGGSGVAVRTLSSTSQTATYTVAAQVADFGSPAATVESISVAVYQISATVGRGIAGYSSNHG